MNEVTSRNLWIVLGILFIFVLKVTLLNISGINILFAILCFVKAYKINKQIQINK